MHQIILDILYTLILGLLGLAYQANPKTKLAGFIVVGWWFFAAYIVLHFFSTPLQMLLILAAGILPFNYIGTRVFRQPVPVETSEIG